MAAQAAAAGAGAAAGEGYNPAPENYTRGTLQRRAPPAQHFPRGPGEILLIPGRDFADVFPRSEHLNGEHPSNRNVL